MLVTLSELSEPTTAQEVAVELHPTECKEPRVCEHRARLCGIAEIRSHDHSCGNMTIPESPP